MSIPTGIEPSSRAIPPHGEEHWAAYAWHFIDADINEGIFWYLVASLAYYHHDVSIFADEDFDFLGKLLLSVWDQLDHEHKGCITIDDLNAGTLYALKAEDYPLEIKLFTPVVMETVNAKRGSKPFEHRHYDTAELWMASIK